MVQVQAGAEGRGSRVRVEERGTRVLFPRQHELWRFSDLAVWRWWSLGGGKVLVLQVTLPQVGLAGLVADWSREIRRALGRPLPLCLPPLTPRVTKLVPNLGLTERNPRPAPNRAPSIGGYSARQRRSLLRGVAVALLLPNQIVAALTNSPSHVAVKCAG